MSLVLDDVWFAYEEYLPILTGACLRIESSEVVAVVAPSGAGKTTLLSIAGLLLRPQKGRVRVGNLEVSVRRALPDHSLRSREIAWIFQSVGLLGTRTVLDNVSLAARIAGVPRRTAERRAYEALESVGLEGFARRRAKELSGGEAQRAGVARGLAARPSVFMADEPTAHLDWRTRDAVADILFAAARHASMLVATHDLDLAARADRVLKLTEGRLVSADAGTLA